MQSNARNLLSIRSEIGDGKICILWKLSHSAESAGYLSNVEATKSSLAFSNHIPISERTDQKDPRSLAQLVFLLGVSIDPIDPFF
jgi:hypothetical protein